MFWVLPAFKFFVTFTWDYIPTYFTRNFSNFTFVWTRRLWGPCVIEILDTIEMDGSD